MVPNVSQAFRSVAITVFLCGDRHGVKEEPFIQISKIQPVSSKVALPFRLIPNNHYHSCRIYINLVKRQAATFR